MPIKLSTDTWVRILVSLMINAVLFGVGAVAVLVIPALAQWAFYLMPLVVIMSFALTPIVAPIVVRRVRIRYGDPRD
jgi:hypothetical protein